MNGAENFLARIIQFVSGSRRLTLALKLLFSPLSIFLVWSFWLASPFIMYGPSSYVRMVDAADSLLSARLALPDLIASGRFGYWNDQSLAGIDRFATAFGGDLEQAAYLLMPGWLAYAALMLLQRFVAGFFLYLLLEKQFGVSRIPAIIAGLYYAYYPQDWHIGQWSGFAPFDNIFTPGIPLFLYLTSWMTKLRWKLLVFASIVLGVAISFNSAHPFAVFFFALLPYWLWFTVRRSPQRSLAVTSIVVLAWLCVELPFWASLMNAGASHRTFVISRPETITWAYRQQLLTGILSSNILPILLTAPALLLERRKHRALKSLLLWISGTLVIVAIYPVVLRLQDNLNLNIAFTADRFFLLLPFLFAVTGGLGLNALWSQVQDWYVTLEASERPKLRLPLVHIGAAAIIVWIAAASLVTRRAILAEMWGGNRSDVIYGNAGLQQFRRDTRTEPPFRVATVPGYYASAPHGQTRLLHPAFAMAYGFDTADGYEPLYTKRYHDLWEQVLKSPRGADIPYFHLWGNRVYMFAGYDEQTTFAQFFPAQTSEPLRFDERFNLNLLSLANVRYIFAPFPLESGNLRLVADGRKPTEGEITFPMPVMIYENLSVLPRYFVAQNSRLFDTDADVLTALTSTPAQELATTAFLTKEHAQAASLPPVSGGDGKVDVLRYHPDEVQLRVQSSHPGILVISSNYNKFWQAEVNGTPRAVMPTYHTFQGVRIEAGESTVILRYRPPYGLIGH